MGYKRGLMSAIENNHSLTVSERLDWSADIHNPGHDFLRNTDAKICITATCVHDISHAASIDTTRPHREQTTTLTISLTSLDLEKPKGMALYCMLSFEHESYTMYANDGNFHLLKHAQCLQTYNQVLNRLQLMRLYTAPIGSVLSAQRMYWCEVTQAQRNKRCEWSEGKSPGRFRVLTSPVLRNDPAFTLQSFPRIQEYMVHIVCFRGIYWRHESNRIQNSRVQSPLIIMRTSIETGTTTTLRTIGLYLLRASCPLIIDQDTPTLPLTVCLFHMRRVQ